jgi:hypothetical protein
MRDGGGFSSRDVDNLRSVAMHCMLYRGAQLETARLGREPNRAGPCSRQELGLMSCRLASSVFHARRTLPDNTSLRCIANWTSPLLLQLAIDLVSRTRCWTPLASTSSRTRTCPPRPAGTTLAKAPLAASTSAAAWQRICRVDAFRIGASIWVWMWPSRRSSTRTNTMARG